MKKAIKIMIIMAVIVLIFSLTCFATPPGMPTPGTAAAEGKMGTIGNKVIGSIQVVGTIISVAVLIFVGIKFMLASPSEKANLKGSLVPYVVGAVILFSAANLVQIIYDIL